MKANSSYSLSYRVLTLFLAFVLLFSSLDLTGLSQPVRAEESQTASASPQTEAADDSTPAAPQNENGAQPAEPANPPAEESAEPEAEPTETPGPVPAHIYYFHVNGDIVDEFTQVIHDGNILYAPYGSALEREGYTFYGWFNEEYGGEQVKDDYFGQPKAVYYNREIHLYAKFIRTAEEATATPAVTPQPENSPAPEESTEPSEPTPTAEATEEPETTPDPEATEDPDATVDPEATLDPEATEVPQEQKGGVQFRKIIHPSEPNVYYHTYIFSVNGTESSKQIVRNNEKLIEPQPPVLDGYTFAGWYTAPNGGGNVFEEFDVPISVTSNREITIYAHMEQVFYAFFHDNNNKIVYTAHGPAGTTVQTQPANNSVAITPTQKLDGWYLNPQFTGGAVTSVQLRNENISLYAKVLNGFWLTYNTNGGSVLEPKFYTAGQNAAAPAAPTKEGYSFGGWYADEQLNTVFTFNRPLAANTTIYAKWTPANTRYDVIYWVEDPDNANSYQYNKTVSKSGTTGSVVTLAAADTAVSQVVGGLSNYVEYARHDQNVTIANDGSTKVNVYYNRKVYQYIFHINTAGKVMTIGGNSYTSTGPKYTINAKFDQTIGHLWPTVANFRPTDQFNRWTPREIGSGWVTKRLKVTPDMIPSSGQTLNIDAYFSAGGALNRAFYMVESFDAVGGANPPDRVSYGGKYYDSMPEYQQDVYTTLVAKDIPGLVNVGTEKKTINGTSHQFFYYKRNNYNLDFNNGGVVNSQSLPFGANISDKGGAPARPANVPSSFIFDGWYTNAAFLNGTKYEFQGKTMPAYNMVLYAYWKAPEVNVKIHLGAESAGWSQEMEFNIPYRSAIPAEKFTEAENGLHLYDQEQFSGWYFKRNGVKQPFNKQTILTENIELWPVINDTAVYSVEYDAAEGSGSLVDTNKYAAGSHAVVLKPNGITPPQGKIFAHWGLLEDPEIGEVGIAGFRNPYRIYYPGAKLEVTGNMRLFAVYIDRPPTTTLTYHYNFEGSTLTYEFGDLQNNQVVYAQDLDGVEVFTIPNGYVFLGWNTKPNGGGDFYNPGDPFRVTIEGSNDLYAQWAKPVTVTTVGGTYIYDGQIKVPKVTVSELPTGYTSSAMSHTRKSDVTHGPIPVTADTVRIRNAAGVDVTNRMQIRKVDGTLEITPRPVTLTSGSAEKEYDGTPLTKDEVTVGGMGFIGATPVRWTVTGTQTEVGESPNHFRYEAIPDINMANYQITQVLGKLKVTAKQGGIVVTVKGRTDSKKYNGAQHSVTGYDVVSITLNGQPTNLYTNNDIALVAGYTASASGKDAGSYPMGLTPQKFVNRNQNFANVQFVVTDGKLDITKRDITLTSGSATKIYDGTPLIKHEVTPSGDGWANGEGARYTYTGTQTLVGTSKNAFSYQLNPNTKADNYNITKVEGDLTVTKLSQGVVVRISGKTASQKYNGQNLTVEGYTVDSIQINGQNTQLYKQADFALKAGVQAKAIGKNAGSYPMGLSPASFENKNPNFDNVQFIVNDGKLEISKRDVTLTSGSATKVYDGMPLIKHEVVASGDNFVAGEGADYSFTGSQTDAGVSPNNFDYRLKSGTLAANYNINKVPGTLTVTKLTNVTVNIRGNRGEFTYDGNEHVVEGYTATASSPLYNTATSFAFSGQARAARTFFGTTPMNLQATQFSNTNPNFDSVRFIIEDGYIKINPINTVTVTIKGNKGTFVYDGNEHVVEGYTATASNPQYDIQANVAFRGSARVARTDVGTSPMGLTAAMFSNTNTNYANVVFVVEDGEIKITPLEGVVVNIAGNKQSFMYDGQPHSAEGYVANPNNPLFVPARDIQFSGQAKATRTEVGTTPMNLQVAQFANKNPNFKDVRFVINDGHVQITPNDKLVVKIKGNTDSKMYNGREQFVDGFDVTEIKLNGQNTTLFTAADVALAPGKAARGKGTDAGSYPMGLAPDSFVGKNPNFANITFQVTDGEMTITKRNVKLTSGSAEKMYDGTPLVNHSVTPSLDGWVAGQGATYTFTGTQTAVGSSENTFAYQLMANTNANNYNITTENGRLVVTELGNIKVKIVGNTKTVTYNGAEQFVEGYVATANTPLYDVSANITFTGTARAARTEVGQTNMNLTAAMFRNSNANFDNVEFTVVDGWIKVNPLPGIRVKIKGNTASEKYDGSQKNAQGYAVESITLAGQPTALFTNADIAFAPGQQAKATGKDVGKYKMNLTAQSFVSGNPNFSTVVFEVTDGELEITKRDVTLTSATDTKPYDGTPLTNHNVAVSGDGWAAGEGATYAFTGSQIAVGTSKNNFTHRLNPNTKPGNYNITKALGDLTVTPPTGASVVVKIKGKEESKRYIGAAQSTTGFTVTAITMAGQPTTLLTPAQIRLKAGRQAVATGTDVGSYTMGLTPADFEHINPNFSDVTFQVEDGKLEITKRSVKLSSASAKKVFDGTPLVKHVVIPSLEGFVAGQGADYSFTGSQTAVGTSPNNFTYTLKAGTNAANYDITTEFGTLEVTELGKVRVLITGETKTVTYDGQAHTISNWTAVSNSPLFNVATDLQYNGPASVSRTDAGKTPFGLTPAMFSNSNQNIREVEFIVKDGFVQVNKRKVSLTSATDSKVYDGTPLTNNTITVGLEGMASGQLFDYNVTGTQTQAGTSINEFSYASSATANVDNYIVTVVKGKLTVRGASVTVTITGNTGTYPFDGAEHTVNGYNAVASDPNFNVNTDMLVRTAAKASRTNVGKTLMGMTPAHFANLNPNFSDVRFVVTDGFVEITPVQNVTVTITGNNTTGTYNGRPHVARGYTMTSTNPLFTMRDIAYAGVAAVARIEIGNSPMGLDQTKFSSRNPNFTNVQFVVTDGFVQVNPATVTVSVTGNKYRTTYDGQPHSVAGYRWTADSPLYTAHDFSEVGGPFRVTQTNAGTYPMGLTPASFTNNNPNINVVFQIVEDGELQIDPANVVVRVVGKQETIDYDGKEHVVTGYTVTANNPAYDVQTRLSFTGTAEARRTMPGTTFMNLTPSQFTNTAPTGAGQNFASVDVIVEDGFLTIKPAAVNIYIRGAQREYRYDGTTKYAIGYEAFSDNDMYNMDEDLLFTGEAKAQRKEVGKTMMHLKRSQFTNLNQLYFVNIIIEDGFVNITPADVAKTHVNLIGTLTIAGKLADRDKPGSFENLVRENWAYPFKNMGKVLNRNFSAGELKEGETPVNTMTVAAIRTFFTNGVPTQDNVTTKESLRILKEAGVDMVTVPSAADNLVSPEIYRESANILNDAGIKNNAYETAANVDVSGFKMSTFAVYSNEFSEDIPARINSLKDGGERLIVVEVHWDEAAYRAEREGENLTEAALEKHVQQRKQEMARAIIDAGAHVVLGYNTETVKTYEEYNHGLIFYGLGQMVSGGSLEPDAEGNWDALIVKLQVLNWEDGKMTVPGFEAIPVSLSSSKDKNDFRPMVYEEGTEGYWRIKKKLNGTWNR